MDAAAAAAPAADAPAKKATKKRAASKPRAKSAASGHPKYEDMIAAAIVALKERGGSSRQSIRKYILANYKVNYDAFDRAYRAGLKHGVSTGVFIQTAQSFRLSQNVAAKAKRAASKGEVVTTKVGKAKKAGGMKKKAASTTAAKPKKAKKAAGTKKTKKAGTKKAAGTKKPRAKKAGTKKGTKRAASKGKKKATKKKASS